MTSFTGIRSNGFTEYARDPLYGSGKKLKTAVYDKTIATGAGANTLHILSGPHSLDDKIVSVIGAIPAFTSANDNDLGFYKKNADGTFTALGTGDELWNGVDLSSALTFRELLFSLNTSLDHDDHIGAILSLGPDKMPAGGVYLGLLIRTASTAASEVLKLEIKIAEATGQ